MQRVLSLHVAFSKSVQDNRYIYLSKSSCLIGHILTNVAARSLLSSYVKEHSQTRFDTTSASGDSCAHVENRQI